MSTNFNNIVDISDKSKSLEINFYVTDWGSNVAVEKNLISKSR